MSHISGVSRIQEINQSKFSFLDRHVGGNPAAGNADVVRLAIPASGNESGAQMGAQSFPWSDKEPQGPHYLVEIDNVKKTVTFGVKTNFQDVQGKQYLEKLLTDAGQEMPVFTEDHGVQGSEATKVISFSDIDANQLQKFEYRSATLIIQKDPSSGEVAVKAFSGDNYSTYRGTDSWEHTSVDVVAGGSGGHEGTLSVKTGETDSCVAVGQTPLKWDDPMLQPLDDIKTYKPAEHEVTGRVFSRPNTWFDKREDGFFNLF